MVKSSKWMDGRALKLMGKEWNALEWAMDYTIEMLNEHSDEDDPKRLEILSVLQELQADLSKVR